MPPVTIADLRARARRRLPRFAFDYLDGGAGSEAGIARNEAAFDRYLLKPRALVDVTRRDLSTELFGRRWRAPFGAAPIGMANVTWPGADEAIARACVAAGIPFTIANAGTTSFERIREVAGDGAWCMVYPGHPDPVLDDLVTRAEAAGYDVLVLTVDAPLQSIRPREIRNRVAQPFRITPAVMLQLALHPQWTLATLAAGRPRLANMEKYQGPGGPMADSNYRTATTTGRFDWDRLKALRERWKRRLVVKGVLAPEDAARLRALGCDGVVVSNHGGRQLASFPATLDLLPAVRAAVGPDFPVLLDSGVRGGEAIIKALALGADFVLVGRAVMYGVGALGRAGAARAIAMLIDEAQRCLGQIGQVDIAGLKAATPIERAG